MVKKYKVCLIKYEYYYVDAENVDAAFDAACFKCDSDPDAWSGPVDEAEIDEL